MANPHPSKHFLKGVDNHKWKGGTTITTNFGYIRITHGRHRGKYAHRRMMEELLEHPLCADYVFPDGKIPTTMEVEHIDHNRTHNCHGNLMLLDRKIHAHLSAITKWYRLKHADEWHAYLMDKVRQDQTPDWVTEVMAVADGEEVSRVLEEVEDMSDADGSLNPLVE